MARSASSGPPLNPEQVRRLLDLNRETGELRWTAQASFGRLTQCVAGSVARNGYQQVKIGKRVYLGHRLVWLLAHGEWPASNIDHIDGNRLNNAPSNLRLATASQNAQNRGSAIQSASGLLGAIHVPGTSRRREAWESRIKTNGVSKWLGLFRTKEAAHAAYLSAKASLHPFAARTAAA